MGDQPLAADDVETVMLRRRIEDVEFAQTACCGMLVYNSTGRAKMHDCLLCMCMRRFSGTPTELWHQVTRWWPNLLFEAVFVRQDWIYQLRKLQQYLCTVLWTIFNLPLFVTS